MTVRKQLLCLLLVLFAMTALLPLSAAAESTGTYRVVIKDELFLLSKVEQEKLRADMEPITAFGNVAFWTTNAYAKDEVEQARLMRRELFGTESGTILVINMRLRKVSIQSYGMIESTIDTDRANTITNNVRNYLTRGDYYGGASLAFQQMGRVLNGMRIPQPMKYLSNACIALMLGLISALVMTFRYVATFRRNNQREELRGAALDLTVTASVLSEVTRQATDDSSSGSSCSSCGGSSCSSCGSGGSSSF